MKISKLLPGATLLALSLATIVSATTQGTAPASATMKAIRFHSFGGPEVLVYEDAPKPEAKEGLVLVRVHAAGVNSVDWKVREGGIKSLAKLPQIPGYDVSGVVEAVGPKVEGFAKGDRVYGYLSLQRGGAYAEYVAVPATELALAPKSLDHVHAAAVPLAALTAWQALVDTAGLKEGQTVLVHAGAGGVGHFAVQIAKAKGAKVIATASKKNHAFLRELGADEVVDYNEQKFEDVAHDVDVVLDPIGGETLARSLGVVKKGGIVVSIVEPPPKPPCEQLGIRGAVILVKPNGKELEELARLIEAKKLKPEVSETVPLAEAKRAHELSQGGHTRGKIVLEVVKP
jgi:NADPH:quinone reductase-like Zn-dependent oxidoreductase